MAHPSFSKRPRFFPSGHHGLTDNSVIRSILLLLLILLALFWMSRKDPNGEHGSPPPVYYDLRYYLPFSSYYSSTLSCMEVGDTTDDEERFRPLPSDTYDRCLVYPPPNDYFQLLMSVLVGLPHLGRCHPNHQDCAPPHHQPYDEHLRRFGEDVSPHGMTMIGKERLANFWSAIHEVERNRIPGAICEFGVWRGGTMMLAAAMIQQGLIVMKRDLYLNDALDPFDGYGSIDAFQFVPLDDVQANFRMFDLDLKKEEGRGRGRIHFLTNEAHFVDGVLVEGTTPWVDRTDPIAVLRVNGRSYDAYQDTMYAAYENVSVGGIVILDQVMARDRQVQLFWEHFKEDHGLVEELVPIDAHAAWFRKKVKVRIDASKKRPSPTPAPTPKPIELPDYRKYHNKYWENLPGSFQTAMATLGFDETSWDNSSSPQPAAWEKVWEDLTDKERTAAVSVGYTEESWESDK